MRWVLLLAWVTACMAACSSRPTRPAGPAPEYEPPRVLPWDAGADSESDDPFAAAAEGEWLDEPGDEADAEAPVDAAAEPADAAAEAGEPDASPAQPDGATVDAGRREAGLLRNPG